MTRARRTSGRCLRRAVRRHPHRRPVCRGSPSRVFAQLLADDDGRMTASELTEALSTSARPRCPARCATCTQTHLIGKERERGLAARRLRRARDAWHEAMLIRDRLLAQIEPSRRRCRGADRWAAARRAAGDRLAARRWRSSSSSATRDRRQRDRALGEAPAPRSPQPLPAGAYRETRTPCERPRSASLPPVRGHVWPPRRRREATFVGTRLSGIRPR